ncbi:hypothetical protein HYT53_05575 [Candidatus Woesearchaeota archaeon]|nr:hypothetical protein [Candidatus Woesearchaeota archaeon]
MDFNKKIGDSSEFNHSANPEERFLVGMFSQITERLKQKYNYSHEELLKLGNNELLVPVSIFAGKLSPAEALAKFLKEKHELNYHEISELTGRDKRSLWANYKRAVKKMPSPFDINDSISVPVSIFNSEKSILEALTSYLKDIKKMRNKKIAQLLNKNPANIWTVYSRARKKENGKK